MRDLTTDFQTALQSDVIRVGVIAEIDYPATPLRAWTGHGDLEWDSKTWLGTGELGGISAVKETGATQATNITLEISGVSSTNLALALADTSQRRRASVWLALFDKISGAGEDEEWGVIADPWRIRRGWTDVHKILRTGQTASISVSVESILSRLRTARTMRWNDHDQQRLFPGDTAGRFAAGIGQRPIYWGVAPPNGAAAAGGSSATPPPIVGRGFPP